MARGFINEQPRRRKIMKDRMSMKSRIVQALREEHMALDERVRQLSRRPFLTPSDEREVLSLKKRKLRAKDALVETAERS